MRTTTAVPSLLALAALTSTAALAQEAASTAPDTNESAIATDPDESPWDRDYLHRWTVRFEPAAYFVAPAGDLTLPGGGAASLGSATAELDTLNLNDPVIAPFGEIHFASERWRVSLSGFGFEGEGEGRADFTGNFGGMPVFRGETVETDFGYQSYQVSASYRFLDYADGQAKRPGVYRVSFAVDAVLGARLHHYDIESSVTPTATGARGLLAATPALETDISETFAEPFAGLRLDVDLSRRFQFDVELTAGAFEIDDHSSYAFDVNAGFGIRITDNLAALAGFRILFVSAESGSGSDSFEFDGSYSGLYWGLQADF